MLNSKVYTKKCVICGKEYKSISVRALTCGKQCRNEYHRRKYREKRSIKTCNNNSISEVLEKAREAGLSYGKYVAMEDKNIDGQYSMDFDGIDLIGFNEKGN